MANWLYRVLLPVDFHRWPDTYYESSDEESSDDESSDDEEDDIHARIRRRPEYYASLWKHYIQPRFPVLRPQPRELHRVPARPNLLRRWIVCVDP